MDECNFTNHQNNNHIWVVGCIDPDYRKTGFDIINIRKSNNLKIFLINHVEAGTFVSTDGWREYNFLDGNESEYHNHSEGYFGFDSHSISHIEETWSHLKNEINSLYNIIPLKNFIHYFREAEFRLSVFKKTSSQIMDIFHNYLKIVYEKNKYIFFKEEYLVDFNNYY